LVPHRKRSSTWTKVQTPPLVLVFWFPLTPPLFSPSFSSFFFFRPLSRKQNGLMLRTVLHGPCRKPPHSHFFFFLDAANTLGFPSLLYQVSPLPPFLIAMLQMLPPSLKALRQSLGPPAFAVPHFFRRSSMCFPFR